MIGRAAVGSTPAPTLSERWGDSLPRLPHVDAPDGISVPVKSQNRKPIIQPPLPAEPHLPSVAAPRPRRRGFGCAAAPAALRGRIFFQAHLRTKKKIDRAVAVSKQPPFNPHGIPGIRRIA